MEKIIKWKSFSVEELMARIRVAQRRIINEESSEEGAAVFKNGDLESDMSSLRVFMASLRKKIEVDTAHPTYIQTHIGTGYRILKL